IQPLLLPARENARLLLRKAGLHRKVGLRQEDRVSVIALFAHCRRALAVGEADCNLFTRCSVPAAVQRRVRLPIKRFIDGSRTAAPTAPAPAHSPPPSAR